MISTPAEPRWWLAGRWWAAVVLMFAALIGLDLWLEDRSPPVPRKPASAPEFRLIDNQSAPGLWLALEDPTLFALPHRQDFSGAAWMQMPPMEFRAADWSEPARWLPLAAPELGAAFSNFVKTNPVPSFPTLVMLEPEPMYSESFPPAPARSASSLRIEGGLAKRRLLSPLLLPSWTYADLLTNSVVQLLVDAQGDVVSAVLLPPGSNLLDADQCALALAKAARFGPAVAAPARPEDPSAGLAIGTLVFQWQTLPAASTNVPPVIP